MKKGILKVDFFADFRCSISTSEQVLIPCLSTLPYNIFFLHSLFTDFAYDVMYTYARVPFKRGQPSVIFPVASFQRGCCVDKSQAKSGGTTATLCLFTNRQRSFSDRFPRSSNLVSARGEEQDIAVVLDAPDSFYVQFAKKEK